MGKNKKEHRKRVEARNRRLEHGKKSFKKSFQQELLKHIELEKQKVAEKEGTEIKVTEPETIETGGGLL